MRRRLWVPPLDASFSNAMPVSACYLPGALPLGFNFLFPFSSPLTRDFRQFCNSRHSQSWFDPRKPQSGKKHLEKKQFPRLETPAVNTSVTPNARMANESALECHVEARNESHRQNARTAHASKRACHVEARNESHRQNARTAHASKRACHVEAPKSARMTNKRPRAWLVKAPKSARMTHKRPLARNVEAPHCACITETKDAVGNASKLHSSGKTPSCKRQRREKCPQAALRSTEAPH